MVSTITTGGALEVCLKRFGMTLVTTILPPQHLHRPGLNPMRSKALRVRCSAVSFIGVFACKALRIRAEDFFLEALESCAKLGK